jgi:hypothetical protein
MSKSATLNARPGSARPPEGWPLSSSGPYHDHIARVSALIPKVTTTDYRNTWISFPNRDASAAMLTLKEKTEPDCTEFTDANALKEHFDQRLREARPHPSGTPERRIYILESLNSEYVAVFGAFFFMDPSFFIDQERTQIWERRHFGTRMTEPLPSIADAQSSFYLPYFEMMHFKERNTDFETSCRTTGRHVGITRLNGNYEQEVVVRRKCSFWSRTNQNGGWDGKCRFPNFDLKIINDYHSFGSCHSYRSPCPRSNPT